MKSFLAVTSLLAAGFPTFIYAQDNSKTFFSDRAHANYRLTAISEYGLTTRETYKDFYNGGVEVSSYNGDNPLLPEVGARFTTSFRGIRTTNNAVLVTNFYGFVGGGKDICGFVTGLRLLAGGEWINITDETRPQNVFEVGGQARAGYEWDNGAAVFLTYTLTGHLQTFGVNVSATL